MKKIVCICMAVACIAIMVSSCNKECVCKKNVTYLTTTDTTTVADSTTMTDSTQASTTNIDSIMYHAGNIYDKKECEYLNVSDTTSLQIVSLTCSMEKKEK